MATTRREKVTLVSTVTALVAGRRKRDGWAEADEVRAQLALHLAGRLDAGCEDRYAAGVAKELRAVVAELEAGGAAGDAFAELARQLSAEVLDPAH